MPATCGISTRLSCGAENTTTSTLSIARGVALLESADVGFADLVAAQRRVPRGTTSSSRCASGVMPAMWNSATEP